MGKIAQFPRNQKSPQKERYEDALKAKSEMQNLPIPALITTINMMVDVLRGRGFEIMDWEQNERTFHKLTIKGGKIYALIAGKEVQDETTESAGNDPGE